QTRARCETEFWNSNEQSSETITFDGEGNKVKEVRQIKRGRMDVRLLDRAMKARKEEMEACERLIQVQAKVREQLSKVPEWLHDDDVLAAREWFQKVSKEIRRRKDKLPDLRTWEELEPLVFRTRKKWPELTGARAWQLLPPNWQEAVIKYLRQTWEGKVFPNDQPKPVETPICVVHHPRVPEGFTSNWPNMYHVSAVTEEEDRNTNWGRYPMTREEWEASCAAEAKGCDAAETKDETAAGAGQTPPDYDPAEDPELLARYERELDEEIASVKKEWQEMRRQAEQEAEKRGTTAGGSPTPEERESEWEKHVRLLPPDVDPEEWLEEQRRIDKEIEAGVKKWEKILRRRARQAEKEEQREKALRKVKVQTAGGSPTKDVSSTPGTQAVVREDEGNKRESLDAAHVADEPPPRPRIVIRPTVKPKMYFRKIDHTGAETSAGKAAMGVTQHTG